MSPASHESNTSYTPLSLRDVLPSLPGNRPLVAAVSRIRRACQRHVRFLPAGLHVRLPHGVGEDHPRPARCAHPPLQPCDVEATTEGVSMSIDQTLRLLAEARGLTVTDIATAIPRAGVSTVSAWMRGDKLTGKDQLDALARTFGVPAGSLLSDLASTLDPARTKGEHDLLAAYRDLNTRQRGALLEVARGMAGHKATRKKP